MKTALLLISLASVLAACAGDPPAKQTRAQEPPSLFTASSELSWINPFDQAPIQFANAYGDTFKAPHGTFGKFPAGFTTPEHIHSHSYHAVVISGVITNPMTGDTHPAKEMGPGSYWYVAANAPHKTACVSRDPCQFYMHQDTNFDFTPLK